MARNSVVTVPSETITQLTANDCLAISFQGAGGTIRIAATSDASAPTDLAEFIYVYAPGTGEVNMVLAEMFLGITSPVRLWVYCDTNADVAVSHA